MKVVIEKVPDGLRIGFTHDTSKKPFVFLVRPAELDQYTGLLRTAMGSTSFKFEFQT